MEKARLLKHARNRPLTAALSALSKFFSPRLRDSRALIPTPVPEATAIIRFCTGNARDTAARAFSPSRDTKILSTTLYMAWTSIEIIIGRDMVISSFLIGMVPILFSCSAGISESPHQ